MADAELTVSFAGPLVTFQDGGRPGNMRYGVSCSGPMDRVAFEAAHAALGNNPGMTAVEISLGGLMLQCTEGSVSIAIAGGDFVIEHAGQKISSWTVLTLQKSVRLSVRAGASGSWAYLAFAGIVQTEHWLGSQATHSTSGFGGGALQSGDKIVLRETSVREERHGDIERPDFLISGPIQVVLGPQDQHFVECALDRFVTETFKVSDAYDRMGMRLNGPDLPLKEALSIPSEPIVRGSVQVAEDGKPTVLLAYHQTTGGYPKIATLISSESDRLAQFRSGDAVRFATISTEEAVANSRAIQARKSSYLAQISVARGTLSQRLMRENFIHGCVFDW